MSISAVIKKQRGWSWLHNTNPTGSRIKRGGQKDMIALACVNYDSKLVPEPFFGNERQYWCQSMRHFLGLLAERRSWIPRGEGGMTLLRHGEEEGP